VVGRSDGQGKDEESRDAVDISSLRKRFPSTQKSRFAMRTRRLWTGIAQIPYVQFYCPNDLSALVQYFRQKYYSSVNQALSNTE
jgi:hypothetical protein